MIAEESNAKKADISACMIVKNEQEYLEKCLKSIEELVGEIIIIDTGSSDKTKDIAKRFTDKIFDFKWTGDFSEARNFSIKKAIKKWVFVLDADEVVAKRDFGKIKEITENPEADAYYLILRDYSNETGRIDWKSSMNDDYEESKIAAGFTEAPVLRLFKNKKDYLFEGKIHETVQNSIKKAKGRVFMTDIVIHHFGSLREKTKILEKKDVYSELLKEKLEKESSEKERFYVLFELAREKIVKNELTEAKKYLRDSIELNPDYAPSMLLLAGILIKEKNYGEAEKLLLKVLSLEQNADAYNNLGIIYSERGELNRALKKFEKALELNNKSADYNFNIGLVYLKMKKENKAIPYFRKAVELNPEYGKRIKFE